MNGNHSGEHEQLDPLDRPDKERWKGRALTAAAVGGPVASFLAGMGVDDPAALIRELTVAVQGPFGALVLSTVSCSALFIMVVKLLGDRRDDLKAGRITTVEEGRKWRSLLTEERNDRDATIDAKDAEIARLNEERVKDARYFGEQLGRLADQLKRMIGDGHE